ncbi:larval cuticle protein 65Ab1-like [Musca vetustissima]|uniref:larval cuticle protein 65Ab1-like n=1 Tax=Musca vetustissima TaxID=27455 RepID=UPI002AB6144E|nr:larval cuticle protein 65Ab1-like [Musca vetustissima]
MKFFIVFAALFAVALAAPRLDGDHAEIVKLDSNVEHEVISLCKSKCAETSDGTSRHEEGKLKEVKGEHGDEHAIVVHGEFSWNDKHDGKVYTVQYVADEHGFQPTGEHIPQLPKH